MAKTPEIGLRDPFKKWTVGDAAALTKSLTAPALEVQKDILDLRKRLLSLNMGTREKADLLKQLASRTQALNKLQNDARTSAKFLNDQRDLQQHILSSLNAVRQQLKEKGLDKDVRKRLEDSEEVMDNLYSKMEDFDVKDFEAIQKSVSSIQDQLDNLPFELQESLLQSTAFNKQKMEEEQKLKDIADAVDDLIEKQKLAQEFFDEQRKATKRMLVNFGYSVADRIGVGSFTLGNALRFGSNHFWGEDSTYKRFKAYRNRWKEAKAALKPVAPVTAAAAESTEDFTDVGEGSRSWVGKFKEYVTDARMFHRRLLQKTDKSKDSESKLMSMIGDIGGAIKGALGWIVKGGWIGALAGALSGLAKEIISKIPGAVAAAWELLKKGAGAAASAGRAAVNALGGGATVGAVALPVAAATALAALGAHEKERIEANPNDPEFKDNAYAQYLRGEANSLKQAGAQNQRKALKQLAPGTASEYLKSGPDASGKYLEGYTKDQLEAMAAGKQVDLSGGPVIAKATQMQSLTGASAPLLNQMDSQTRNNVEAMAKEYLAKTGRPLNVGDSFSSAQSADGKPAGLVFNPSTSQSAELRNLGLLSKYKLDTPSGTATPSAAEVTPAQPKSPVIVVPSESSKGDSGGSRDTIQPSTSMGVKDIPLFNMDAGDMLAVNLGVLN